MEKIQSKEKPNRNKTAQITNSKISLVEWVRSHKIKTILIVLTVLIVPLFLIWFLYSGILPTIISSGWSEGDLLSYIAGFETLLGTVILSYLALSQTEKIKKDDDRLNKADVKRPFFVIDRIEKSDYKIDIGVIEKIEDKKIVKEPFTFQFTNSYKSIIRLYLKNIGEGVATNVDYIDASGKKHMQVGPSWIYIEGEKEIPIRGSLFDENGELHQTKTIKVTYQNMVGIRYSQAIDVNIYKESFDIAQNDPSLNIEFILNFSVMISPQRLEPSEAN